MLYVDNIYWNNSKRLVKSCMTSSYYFMAGAKLIRYRLNTIGAFSTSESTIDLGNIAISSVQIGSRSLVNQTGIQGDSFSVQILDSSLYKTCCEEDGIKLRLLGRDRGQRTSDLRNKWGDNAKNSLSLFIRDRGRRSNTTVSTSLFEESLKGLFLAIDCKSSTETRRRGESIDLLSHWIY